VKVVDTILDAVGDTPMVRLKKVTEHAIFTKAEFLNPGGSVKDRVAKYLLEEAEQEGRLKKGSVIMEPSSGNTGIGITLVGVQKGYRVIIVMPENMSEERKKIIRALGGELILTPAEGGIDGAVQKTMELAAKDPAIYVPQHF
jgi:cysteine synthase A